MYCSTCVTDSACGCHRCQKAITRAASFDHVSNIIASTAYSVLYCKLVAGSASTVSNSGLRCSGAVLQKLPNKANLAQIEPPDSEALDIHMCSQKFIPPKISAQNAMRLPCDYSMLSDRLKWEILLKVDTPTETTTRICTPLRELTRGVL